MRTFAGKPTVIVIGGPTGSGKSQMALDIAKNHDGVVINADSMQVYRGVEILTSQPSREDKTQAPHRLYGMFDPTETCSAARWVRMAIPEIGAAIATGRIPVVVGGTGLYMQALMEGLSPVPSIPDKVRQETRKKHAEIGSAAMLDALAKRDPETAARLRQEDSQRIMRAWEVLHGTGKTLTRWHKEGRQSPPPWMRFMMFVLNPNRARLFELTNERFRDMVRMGALNEVRKLMEMTLPENAPVSKAIGVPELMAHLRGEITLEKAITLSQETTVAYARRQITWFRNQVDTDRRIHNLMALHTIESHYEPGVELDVQDMMAKVFTPVDGG